MNFSRPDGRIDLNGKTHRTINQKLKAVTSSITANHKVPWMVTAFKEVGQAEVSGKKANPRILEYFKASKFWGTDDSGGKNAWCASFVAWVMKKNGYAAVENAFRAKAWTGFGKKIKDPVYGAIGVKVAAAVGMLHLLSARVMMASIYLCLAEIRGIWCK